MLPYYSPLGEKGKSYEDSSTVQFNLYWYSTVCNNSDVISDMKYYITQIYKTTMEV